MTKNLKMNLEKSGLLSYFLMEAFIKASGLLKKMQWMGVESKYGPMDLGMMDSGKMAKRMVMDVIYWLKQILIRKYVMNFINLDLKIFIQDKL